MLHEITTYFQALPVVTQVVMVLFLGFLAYLFRKQIGHYIPGVFYVVLGKMKWVELKATPESEVEQVVKAYRYNLVRTKIVYELPPQFPYRQADEVRKDLTRLLAFHRQEGAMMVIVTAAVPNLPERFLPVFCEFVDNAVEFNNVIVLFVFPEEPRGCMKRLHNYIIERTRLAKSVNIMVKLDDRRKTRKTLLGVPEGESDA